MDLFAGLNSNQLMAVETTEGRVLVLAGAGSGKTRLLTARMAHLIINHKVPPQAILGLTFTNKAAAEMRCRLAGLVDGRLAKLVSLNTFHGFCMQLLRREIHLLGYTCNFTLYDEKDIQRILAAIARDILEHEGSLPSLVSSTEIISLAKNRGLHSSAIVDANSKWHTEFVRSLYERLQASMRAYNAVDFDSLLCLTVELFEKYPEVLQRYQKHFRYIMIDEYQDTNPIQYRLADMLSGGYSNLCVVGDDDQSIYGWRGADVQNILNFKDATVIKLEQNYRSQNTILKAANAVIANNQKRHGKALWSLQGDGNPIEIFHAPNETNEAEAVVCRMDKLREKYGLHWGDIAILYRSNALSRAFELALLKYSWKDVGGWTRGVPYKVYGGNEFYERKEIKDLMAYLRVIVNPLDQESLLRIINFPRRGIGDAALDLLTAYNRANQISLWELLESLPQTSLVNQISDKALRGIGAFIDIILTSKRLFDEMPLADALSWLIEKIQYKKAIHEEVKSDQMRQFKWDNVQAFINSMRNHSSLNVSQEMSTESPSLQPLSSPAAVFSLNDFISTMTLDKNWEGVSNKKIDSSCVTLMTFHSAKGLEFPACFLVGLEDHIMPHEKSHKLGIEEERRIMYVAITRAMRFLTLSRSCSRKRMGVETNSEASRFLSEIPETLCHHTVWHKID